MVGTKKQTSQADLEKLIKYWPGHFIIGSKPYQKGCRIYLSKNNQLLDEFRSNDEAFSTMVGQLTGKTPWWPGKRDEQKATFFQDLQIQPDSTVLHSTAVKALNLRDEADRLMRTINIDPLLPAWRSQLMQLIKN